MPEVQQDAEPPEHKLGTDGPKWNFGVDNPKRNPGADAPEYNRMDVEERDFGIDTDSEEVTRRRRKPQLVKKFECPEQGCGKSYSRAEHL